MSDIAFVIVYCYIVFHLTMRQDNRCACTYASLTVWCVDTWASAALWTHDSRDSPSVLFTTPLPTSQDYDNTYSWGKGWPWPPHELFRAKLLCTLNAPHKQALSLGLMHNTQYKWQMPHCPVTQHISQTHICNCDNAGCSVVQHTCEPYSRAASSCSWKLDILGRRERISYPALLVTTYTTQQQNCDRKTDDLDTASSSVCEQSTACSWFTQSAAGHFPLFMTQVDLNLPHCAAHN